jgi:AcrR family transcriptional regulator
VAGAATSRRAQRGREEAFRRGDQREQAILDSVERLLEGTSLRDITIEQIARGAGISRPTLYFYFESKAQMLAALLARTVEEVVERFQKAMGDADEPLARIIGRVVDEVIGGWRRHSTVWRAAIEEAEDDAARQQWADVGVPFIEPLAELIARERESGALPDTGETPHEISAVLSWMVERNLYQLFSRPHSKSEERRMAEVLKRMGLRAMGNASAQLSP